MALEAPNRPVWALARGISRIGLVRPAQSPVGATIGITPVGLR